MIINLKDFKAIQAAFDTHKKVFRTRLTPAGQKLVIDLKCGGHLIFDNPGDLYVKVWDGKAEKKHAWRKDMVPAELSMTFRVGWDFPDITEITDDYFVVANGACILIP